MIEDTTSAGRPGVRIAVKVVPGAKRDQIVGPLGDRLKIRVSAPPEGGKANKAVCALLAQTLGIKSSAVSVIVGAGSPEKTVLVEGMTADEVRTILQLEGSGQ